MNKAPGLFLVLSLLSIAIAGCGGDKPTPQTVKAAQIKPAAESAKKTETKNAPTIQPADSWPSDIPAEVPKYTGGSLKRISKPDPGQKKVSVMINNTNEESYRTYLKKLQDGGFVKSIEISDNSQTMFSGKKGGLEVSAAYNNKDKSVLIMSLKH
ncbi:MAG: hypothetical protein AB9917_16255 [Negativicutes bacterium]